ncbi:hypothetical protein EDD38_7512 [Kitasatospora cineracea]|uniref:Uncharacterized protein n=2 Tax=Kitasatospora cineracea TaxID=88074 RepID=A0A3N4RG40_9ACTN|nr:hypothetical protein EDD38_7379 [Kitasatospora cineracea]RPE27367.1 hypothetical protein EDD38_7512 [Kitasatospora cineracea]
MVEEVVAALGDRTDLIDFVRKLAEPAERTDANVPIRESRERIAHIKEKAEAQGTTVTAVITTGVADFLAGTLPVPKPVRARPGTSQADGMLNVRPDAELIVRLKEHCAQAPESWLRPAAVYAAILDRFDPPAPADADAAEQG